MSPQSFDSVPWSFPGSASSILLDHDFLAPGTVPCLPSPLPLCYIMLAWFILVLGRVSGSLLYIMISFSSGSGLVGKVSRVKESPSTEMHPWKAANWKPCRQMLKALPVNAQDCRLGSIASV